MTLGHGPKIVRDGLVFAYDQGDSAIAWRNARAGKSWRGAPGTNASGLTIYTYWTNSGSGTWSSNDTSVPRLYPDIPVTSMEVTTTGNLHISPGGGNISAGDWTLSVWIWIPSSNSQSGGSFPYFRPQPANNNAGYLYTENGLTGWANVPKNQWVRISKNFSNSTNTSAYISCYLDNAGDKVYFTAPQLENRSFATPHINAQTGSSTRSSTTSLLDWAGGNTITLNGLQYNSDGTFQTSGATTTDYLSIANGALSAQASSGNWTLDFWLKLNARNSSLDHILQTGSGNNFLWFLSGNVLYFENTSQTSITLPTISTGTWFNLTMTGSGGSVQVYKDGSYVGAMTNTTTFTIASTIGIIMGQEMDSNGGLFAANQSYQGYWGATRFYNRQLSSDEVESNFNAHRGRYGL